MFLLLVVAWLGLVTWLLLRIVGQRESADRAQRELNSNHHRWLEDNSRRLLEIESKVIR